MRRCRPLVVLLICLSVSACAATTTRVGDLGRPVSLERTGAVPDRYLAPPHSADFNETDEEKAMADRLWRFHHAPHVSGWFIPRLQPQSAADDPSRYYNWLQKTRYRSSEVRYNTLSGDIQADLLTLPATFETICAVETVDRQRAIALAEVGQPAPGVAERVAQRKLANRASGRSFADALRYRHASYAYALDNLLIETPHAHAVEVDALLGSLARWVQLAEAETFCKRPKSGLVLPR